MADGQQNLPGRRGKAPARERVAAKVAAFKDSPPGGEGVQPLNPGFFLLQRMRLAKQNRGPKKVRGK